MRTLKCPTCGKDVEVNGVGSMSTEFNKKINWLVKTFMPKVCRAFREAADQHDLDYHDKSVCKFVADYRFYESCKKAARDEKKYNWLERRYLNKMAGILANLLNTKSAEKAFIKAKKECDGPR